MDEKIKLTQREMDELADAVSIAEETTQQIMDLEHSARMGNEIDLSEIWKLRNSSAQISAVLYNISLLVYRNAAPRP